jgi:MFS family permease
MKGSQWGGWCVAGLFYLFDVFLRLTVDVITSELQAEFTLSADGVSSAFSSSFFYGYAAMQMPVGFFLDRIGPRWTILLASLLSCFGCVLFSCADTVWVGTVARVVSGIGCGCGWLGAVKVTRNSFGVKDTSKVRAIFAVTCMLGGLGGLTSQTPFQILVHGVGWRAAFRIASGVPILIALLSFCFVGDDAYEDVAYEDVASSEERVVVEDGQHSMSTHPMSTSLLSDTVSHQDVQPVQSESASSSFRALRSCLRTPRMWSYAIYLGSTDAPFETFAGLWGVAFLTQVYGWTTSKAAVLTTVVVVLSTVSQLITPALQSYFKTVIGRLRVLVCLALLGFLSFLPFLTAPLSNPPPGGDGMAYISCVALGLSVASCTIIWSIISSDPLCRGTADTGIISGAVNTLCIGYDAVIQQITGVVLTAMWDGGKNASNEPVYGADAFSRAFMVLAGSFLIAAVSSSLATCDRCHHATLYPGYRMYKNSAPVISYACTCTEEGRE